MKQAALFLSKECLGKSVNRFPLNLLNTIGHILFPILIPPMLACVHKEESVMAVIVKAVHKFESSFDRKVEQFACAHPFLAFLAIVVGIPIFILCTVFVCTILITLPFSLIFGWL